MTSTIVGKIPAPKLTAKVVTKPQPVIESATTSTSLPVPKSVVIPIPKSVVLPLPKSVTEAVETNQTTMHPPVTPPPVVVTKPKIKMTPVVSIAQSLPDWRMNGLATFSNLITADLAKELEAAVYLRLHTKYKDQDNMEDHGKYFQKLYNHRIRDLSGLLNPSDDTYQAWIKEQLISRQLTIERFITMKPWEVCPESWKNTLDLFNKELSGMGQESHASCTLFKCGRCGKNDTKYYEMQTRSSDEPMTTYITCNVCKNHWKQ